MTEKTGDKWKDYNFQGLLKTVVDISEIEQIADKNITVKTDRLIKVLKSERSMIERLDEYNRRTQTK